MWTNKEDMLKSLKQWRANDPSLSDKPIAKGDDRVFTLNETIEEIEKDSKYGKKLLEAALGNDDACSDGCCDHDH